MIDIFSDRLFGIPFSICDIDPTSYNKRELIRDIKSNYRKNPNRNKGPIGRPEDNVHHAYNDWNNPEYIKSNYSSLIKVYEKIIPSCLTECGLRDNFNFTFEIVNYSCMSEGSYMSPHHHVLCDFVGLHYIQFDPETHIQTEYINGHPFSLYQMNLRPHINEMLEDGVKNSMYSQYWKLPVKEDSFHIVPGFLRHQVPRQPKCKKLRMAVIINIDVKRQ